MRSGLKSLLSEGLLMGLSVAGGYAIGWQFTSSIEGEAIGVVVAALCAGLAITWTRREARQGGYRHGYRDGRDGSYDRSNDFT